MPKSMSTKRAGNGELNLARKPTGLGFEPQFRKLELKKEPRRTHLVQLTLMGLPPGLLMNPMDEHTLQCLATGQKPQKKAGDRNQNDICEDKIYRNAEGVMCIPQTWLWAALSHAGRQIGYGDGKAKVATADSTKLPEFLTFSGMDFPFEGADDDGNIPWEANLMRGVNTSTEGATGIVRPLVKAGWKVIIMVEFNATKMPVKTLVDLFGKAGEIAGLGDFRPQKRGPFGTFTVEEVETAELFSGADGLMMKSAPAKKGKKKTEATDEAGGTNGVDDPNERGQDDGETDFVRTAGVRD